MKTIKFSARLTQYIPILFILVFGLAAYSNSFKVPFLFDDFRNIIKSEVVQDYWIDSETISISKKIYSRPLTNLTYALNYAASGTTVWPYHAFNLAVHLFSALILFGIIRRSFLSKRFAGSYESVASWLAFATALLWVVHPLQTQAVTYIVQRAESLMAFFYLAALYCVIRGATTSPRVLWSFLAVVACFMGMGSKQVMVTAPLMILIYDRIFLAETFKEIFKTRKWVYLGFALSWVVLAALVRNDVSMNLRPSAGFEIDQISPWEYAINQPAVLLHYLKLAIWPDPLVFDYLWPINTSGLMSIWVPLGTIVCLLICTFVLLKKVPSIGYLMLWFFMVLAPTSSIMPIGDLAVEHRMYLPLAGLVALFVVLGFRLLHVIQKMEIMNHKIILASMLLILLTVASGFAGLSIMRNNDYQSEIHLWQDTVEKRPENFRAWTGLGNAFIKAEHFREAEEPFQKALEIKPNSAITHYNFALALVKTGRVEDSIRHYETAVQLDETLKNPGYHTLMGDVFRSLERWNESLRQYQRAIEIDDQNIEAYFGMGVLLAGAGRADEAIALYQRVLELNPIHARAHNNLGTLLVQKGAVVEALRHYAEAIKIDSQYETAQKNFMILNQQLKKLRQS